MTAHTHFKCSVEYTEAPSTLPATFDNLHAELVFCVGSEVVDMNIQISRVHHFVPPAGSTAAQLVLDRVQAVVVNSLASSETRVSPHHNDCSWRKHGSLDSDWWHYGCWWLWN